MPRCRSLLLLLPAIFLAVAAQARSLPDGGVTGQEVTNVLQQKGYKAQLTTDKQGDPLIRSASGGIDFLVLYYECKGKPRCASIQFYAGFKKQGITPQQINEWNANNRFGRAYLDKEFDPRVEMDVDVEHGATTEAIDNDIERWVSVLAAFAKFIDW